MTILFPLIKNKVTNSHIIVVRICYCFFVDGSSRMVGFIGWIVVVDKWDLMSVMLLCLNVVHASSISCASAVIRHNPLFTTGAVCCW
jgi:hypothetical protein